MQYRRLVMKRFGRAARGYENESTLQEEVAVGLLRLLEHTRREAAAGRPARVLDAGCGTGRLVWKALASKDPPEVVGLDMTLPMLLQARTRPGVWKRGPAFVNGLCEALPFGNETFDLVVSNLAYQWVRGLEDAFREVSRVLSRGGTFAFSTLGPLTLAELQTALARADRGRENFTFQPFASMREVRRGIERAGLEPLAMERKNTTRTYDDNLALLRTLKRTGATARGLLKLETLGGAALLRRTMREYEKRYARGKRAVGATYEIILAVTRKP